jgi:hypothetical protein
VHDEDLEVCGLNCGWRDCDELELRAQGSNVGMTCCRYECGRLKRRVIPRRLQPAFAKAEGGKDGGRSIAIIWGLAYEDIGYIHQTVTVPGFCARDCDSRGLKAGLWLSSGWGRLS